MFFGFDFLVQVGDLHPEGAGDFGQGVYARVAVLRPQVIDKAKHLAWKCTSYNYYATAKRPRLWNDVTPSPKHRPDALLLYGARWLAGWAILGGAAGLAAALAAEIFRRSANLWIVSIVLYVGLALVVGAGGGLLLVWLRGERLALALQRAGWGLLGALFGLLCGIGAVLPFVFNHAVLGAMVVGTFMGLCAGVGQDGAAPPGPGRSPWWPVAMTVALLGAWVAAVWITPAIGFRLQSALWDLGPSGGTTLAVLALGMLVGTAGGVLGLPILLPVARGWSKEGPASP